MRRLTLILSDLYLPEEADGAVEVAAPLPNLSWLLRFARAAERVDDWRRWLLRQLDLPDLADVAVADIAARAFLDPGRDAATWLATPVRLSARLDHVRLETRGLLRLEADEAAAFCAEFATMFAPHFQLHAAGERNFLLTGLEPRSARTVDPARLLGADIGGALPDGGGAPLLRRLGAEIEMWLHASELNVTRERAGKPRISTLWLWGGGGGRRVALPRLSPQVPMTRLHGTDAFLHGLAAMTRMAAPTPAPVNLDQDASVEHRVIELTPMSGEPRDSLDNLDANTLAAARHALEAGALTAVDIVVNDRRFHITSRARWKFWRHRRGWLENLARPAVSAQV